MNRWRLVGIGVVVVMGAVALWQLSLAPSHDRNWQEHYARTPGAVVTDDVVRLRNVRNWGHDEMGVTSRAWLDEVVIDPTEITRVWFALSSFSDSPYVGHSFLSFEFADGRAYTFSIEARREEGEEYGAVVGVLRQFELWYGWGTEEDFLGVSLVLLQRPLELYPLELTARQRVALFRAAALATQAVEAAPRFYNTLTANCTNLLAKAINAQAPGTIPYSLAWNFPGLAPEFLAQEEFIIPISTALPLREQYKILPTNERLRATLVVSPEQFSQVLREEVRTAAGDNL